MSHPPPGRALPPPAEDEHDHEGASANERILSAARDDNEELYLESIELEGADINFQDGLGNTALHYAVLNASTSLLDLILEHPECDVDLRNKLEGETPLHLAVKTEEDGREGLRLYLVQTLTEAGANPLIKNGHSLRPVDLLPPPPPPPRRGAPVPPKSDEEEEVEQVRSALRKAEAEMMFHSGGGGGVGDGDVADEGDIIGEDDIASD